jgi:hypothetical protein
MTYWCSEHGTKVNEHCFACQERDKVLELESAFSNWIPVEKVRSYSITQDDDGYIVKFYDADGKLIIPKSYAK